MNTYTPMRGSLAEQVVSYFKLHPNDTMTLDEVTQTFRPSGAKGNIKLGLEKAIDAGLLRWSGGLLMAGRLLDPAAAPDPSLVATPAAPSLTATGSPRTGLKRGHLPPIDLDAVKVEYGVPVPVGFSSRQRESRWTALLDKLDKPGASTPIPREYNGSLTGWIRKLKKAHPEDKRTYRVGLDMQGVNRVWRTA